MKTPKQNLLKTMSPSVFENKQKLAIHHNPNIIFIHIPKTGGNSIRKGLFGHKIKGTGHASIRSYRNLNLTDYYKFSVIRDPYDRLRSLYYYTHEYHKKGVWNKQILECKTFDEFCVNLPEMYKRQDNPGLFSQMFWITDFSGAIAIDDLFLFGDMKTMSKIIFEKTGNTLSIRHLNRSSNSLKTIRDNEESRQLIENIYQDDVAMFRSIIEHGHLSTEELAKLFPKIKPIN